MKTRYAIRLPLVLLIILCALVSGCATQGTGRKAARRFHEESSADLILKFNRWDTIQVLRPDSRQGGFLPIYERAALEAQLESSHMRRELGVVVLGFLFSNAQELSFAKEWADLLSKHGFRRIVVVRTGSTKGVDGLPVVYDSASQSGLGTSRK